MESLALPSVFSPLIDGINAVFGWFHQLYSGDWYILIIGVISFVIAGRLILAPLFAGRVAFGGSDTVSNSEKKLSIKDRQPKQQALSEGHK